MSPFPFLLLHRAGGRIAVYIGEAPATPPTLKFHVEQRMEALDMVQETSSRTRGIEAPRPPEPGVLVSLVERCTVDGVSLPPGRVVRLVALPNGHYTIKAVP